MRYALDNAKSDFIGRVRALDSTEKGLADLSAALKQKFSDLINMVESWTMPWSRKNSDSGSDDSSDSTDDANSDDATSGDEALDPTVEYREPATGETVAHGVELLAEHDPSADFAQLLTDSLAQVAADGAQEALQVVSQAASPLPAPTTPTPLSGPPVPVAMSVAPVQDIRSSAADWARANGAQLVTNVSDSTKRMLAASIANGIEDGLSISDIADKLEANFAFSEERARLIARTEVATADGAGNMAGYVAGGVKKKEWLAEANACDICKANEAAGAIPLSQIFPSGDITRPAHPNCRCDVVPVFDEDDDEESDDEQQSEEDGQD